MKAKEFIPAEKPRNFVAKNAKMGGAGQHKDKKKAEKQGDFKHKNKQFVEQDMDEARMSPQVKLQRAWEREQAKSAASRKRGQELLNPPKKDEPKKDENK